MAERRRLTAEELLQFRGNLSKIQQQFHQLPEFTDDNGHHVPKERIGIFGVLELVCDTISIAKYDIFLPNLCGAIIDYAYIWSAIYRISTLAEIIRYRLASDWPQNAIRQKTTLMDCLAKVYQTLQAIKSKVAEIEYCFILIFNSTKNETVKTETAVVHYLVDTTLIDMKACCKSLHLLQERCDYYYSNPKNAESRHSYSLMAAFASYLAYAFGLFKTCTHSFVLKLGPAPGACQQDVPHNPQKYVDVVNLQMEMVESCIDKLRKLLRTDTLNKT